MYSDDAAIFYTRFSTMNAYWIVGSCIYAIYEE